MAYTYTNQANGVGVPFNYTRGNPIPLDSWSLFTAYADALSYAQSNPVSYPGQVLTVIDVNGSIVYVIAAGGVYTQAMKDEDDLKRDDSANYPDYVPHAAEGTEVGAELTSQRTLVRLGTKSEIEAASASAVMNWLNSDGTPTS